MNLLSRAAAFAAACLVLVSWGCGSPAAATRERNSSAPALAGTAPAALPANAPSEAAAVAAAPTTGLEIARVGGTAIDASELLALWLHTESNALGDYVDKLVNTRIARLESQRIGVRCSEPEIETRYQQARTDLEALVRRNGAELSPEAYVEQRLGLDPKRYFARVRQQCEDQVLAERAVRAWLLSNERAELRVIVVADAARAAEAKSALAGGLAFEEAAKRYSLDDSRDKGGHVPPIVRSERSPLAQLAFQTRPGELAGPLQQGGRMLIARVDAHLPAVAGSWAEIGADVLRSLAEQPVEEAEFWQWRGAMERRYEVDLSSLLQLAR